MYSLCVKKHWLVMQSCRASASVVTKFKIKRRNVDSVCITTSDGIQIQINNIAIEARIHNNTTFAIHIMQTRACAPQERNKAPRRRHGDVLNLLQDVLQRTSVAQCYSCDLEAHAAPHARQRLADKSVSKISTVKILCKIRIARTNPPDTHWKNTLRLAPSEDSAATAQCCM